MIAQIQFEGSNSFILTDWSMLTTWTFVVQYANRSLSGADQSHCTTSSDIAKSLTTVHNNSDAV